MVNNYFAYDSLLSVSAEQESFSAARECLSVFYASGAIVSDHKTNLNWLVLMSLLPGFLLHGLLYVVVLL